VIGRAAGQIDRIAMAVLVGALLAGSAGFTMLNQQPVSAGMPTRVVISPDERSGLPPSMLTTTASPTVAAAAAATNMSVPAGTVPATAPPERPSFAVARVAPHLEAVEPKTSGVGVYADVVMTFSEPMNRPSVESTFDIQPKVEGRIVWSDDFTLRFAVFKFAYATTYQVEVRGRSLRGVPVSGSRSWSFTTVSAPPDVLLPGPPTTNVPILTYHYIRVNPNSRDRMGFALSVTPADFAAQMDWLARYAFHPITTEDLYNNLGGARGLPSKPVILTFDDGYADFYTTALPILRSHDFKAVAYVVSGFIGWPGYMTAAQIREADRSGIEIGSHTVSHVNLAQSSAAAVRAQLVESKQAIERVIGHEVVSFCYPSGKYTSAVASQVKAAGYHDSTTTIGGYSHTMSDRYVWARLRVSGGEPLDQFAVAVNTAF